MERRPPIIEIEGTPFYVDISRFALVENGNSGNEISFLDMKDYGTHYEFDYNPKTKNFSRGNKYGEDEIPVKVQRLGLLDPYGMMKTYNCTLDDLERRTDYGIIVDYNKELYHRRCSGERPTIDLAGRIYEILYEDNSLHPKGWEGETVFLSDYRQGYYDEEEEMYYLYYDTSENRVVDPGREGSWDRTEDCIMVKVRDLASLDSLKSAEKEGNAYTGIIFCNVHLNYVADTIPLKKNDINVNELMNLRQKYEEKRRDRLPIINIMGTDFIVDVVNYELRQRGNERNILYLQDWKEVENGYGFYYDTALKNIPKESFNLETTQYVEIPEFVKMAPLEVAEKTHKNLLESLQMTDFDLMVNSYMFKERINGNLPTIYLGRRKEAFYVDLQRGMLRPYCPSSVPSIRFAEIEKYFEPDKDIYLVPFNNSTNKVVTLDYTTIKEVPKDVDLLSIPSLKRMDRVGWNILHGFDAKAGLKLVNFQMDFIAEKIASLEISLTSKTGQNCVLKEKQQIKNRSEDNQHKSRKQKRGRGI
ncbi:hypothetical protein [Chryseobacterium sp. T20]|uniref:hypothetical protein n=1 Tax=Chryseobacterium sp. T20 TaxID=3395375 RepID=UPI0039BC28F0